MAIYQARRGDLGPIVAMAERASSWSVDTMAIGQTFAILCSEDVGRHPAPLTSPDTLFGHGAIDFWVESCRVWPKGRGHSLSEQTVLEIPALILSGDLDPVTPPSRGEAMRKHFPNSLHVIAPGGGHNVSFSGCIPRLIAEFIDAARMAGTRYVVCCCHRAAAIRHVDGGRTAMMALRGLRKTFGSIVAVSDVSFVAANGEVTGLLGPNGAGKTTTLRMLTGALKPERGTVMIDDIDAHRRPFEARARLGVVPETCGTLRPTDGPRASSLFGGTARR